MSEDSVLQRGARRSGSLRARNLFRPSLANADLQARTQEAISRNSSLQEGPVAKGPAIAG